MKKFQELISIFKSINAHPLAGKHRFIAYSKFIKWQVKCLSGKERKIPFTNKTFLWVRKGMTGATGNIYMGLHEFEDMGFLLHFLRKSDLFFDVGANIGSYTILASGHVGSQTIAFEPVYSTFKALEKNISINKVESLATALNMGVGSEEKKLYFTNSHDTVNHVVLEVSDSTAKISKVDVNTLDNSVRKFRTPSLIKIDVEGFETEVLRGMSETLADQNLKAIIIELNGSGARYGYNENDIHNQLISSGFQPYSYEPFSRQLLQLKDHTHLNTLYLRDLLFVKERLKSANQLSIFSESF